MMNVTLTAEERREYENDLEEAFEYLKDTGASWADTGGDDVDYLSEDAFDNLYYAANILVRLVEKYKRYFN